MDFDKRLRQYRSIEERREYMRLHAWVYRNLGKANHCSADTSHESRRYHWANISQQYKKDLDDWMQLCPRCHIRYDGVSDEFRETKRRQALGNRNRAKPVSCLELGKSWPDARAAARELNIGYRAINNCLRGLCRTSGGYHWEYGK